MELLFRLLLTILLLLRFALDFGHACTIIAVGKDASATGHPMVGHTDDSGMLTTDVRFVRVPRKHWPQGSQRHLFPWQVPYPRVVTNTLGAPDYAPVNGQLETKPVASVPQVPKTWAYWDMDYGVQNEVGLSIGESTCTAKTAGWPKSKPHGRCGASIEDMTKIAMERCETARCAAELMGQIAVEHGFYSDDCGEPENPAFEASAECLVIADATPGELWIFDVLTGKNNGSAIWAAQRVPSNHVVAVANAFTIRKMNLSDHANFMYSPGVTHLAEEMGWWSSKQEASADIFDFFGAYGFQPPATDVHETNKLSFYSGRRMWRIFSLLSPDEGAKLDPNRGNLPRTLDPYPASVPAPTNSVTLQMVLEAYRDHYEGTPYDLTQGMAAGPWGNPNRGTFDDDSLGLWERAISMHRTGFAHVAIARPGSRSVVWLCLDSPHGSVWVPFYGAASAGAPNSFHSHLGSQASFSSEVAWWAFSVVNQYAERNYRLINAEVRQKAHETEKKAIADIAAWELEAATKSSEDAALELLTARSNALATEVVNDWWKLSEKLLGKYSRYVVTYKEGDDTPQLYPDWWLRSPEVGYATWAAEGPFHGVLLSTVSDTRAAAEAGTPHGSWIRHGSQQFAFFGMLLVTAAIAAITHQVGLRQGQESVQAWHGYTSVHE